MSARAVTELRRDHELSFSADLHSDDALIPTLDHLAAADLEVERFAGVARAVELPTVHERARVVDGNIIAGLRCRAGSDRVVRDLELFRSGRKRRAFGRFEVA